MSRVNIHGAEYPIGKVFSDEFVFTIPLYQRPYAWSTEQAEEMLEDFLSFLSDNNDSVEEINPYFLGSIVLIKADKPDAQVVDGQQRLTTLTILLAVLRASVPIEHTNDLTTYLYQKGSSIAGTPNRYRLTLRERDAHFFQQYIQNEAGINQLVNLNYTQLSDSQRNIKDNAMLFLKRLQEISDLERVRLAQFIVNRCFLVVVSTPDFDSAYRIFSVLNDRGLNLSHTDILKAEIIGQIPNQQQDKYTVKWEYIEEKLGREMFQDLFTHIRMIYRKAKPRESVLKEFRQFVRPTDNPQKFIDETLSPLADAFFDIKNATYQSAKRADEINRIFRWLNRIDNFDWVPAAILYLSQNHNNYEKLLRFFYDLERLTAGLFIRRTDLNARVERYSKLLTAIESGEDLYKIDSPLQLTAKEQNDILQNLNADFLILKIRRYVLLRLDTALSEGEATYNFPIITVEHVLPQHPAHNSVWIRWFPDKERREKYVHCLGNLVLLSKAKNNQAQNYDFDEKKRQYFTTAKGVSSFALTTQVLREQKWTPEVIERRQKELTGVLKQVWRL